MRFLGSNVKVSGDSGGRTHEGVHGRALTLRRSTTEPPVTSAQSHGHTEVNISCQPNISTDYRDVKTSNGVNFIFSDAFLYLNRVDKVILVLYANSRRG